MIKYVPEHPMHHVLLFVLAVGLLSAGCGKQDAQKTESQPPETHEVEIRAEGFLFYFQPEELTVKPGDTVRWTASKKGEFHLKFKDYPEGAEDVLSENGKLESPDLKEADDTWEVHFSEEYPTGEYHYVCTNHEDDGMQGWIQVKPQE
jgi:plastocyanin